MIADDACTVGMDKQKKLLQGNVGHFSMIKMLHLADLITELNGTPPHLPPSFVYICIV